MPIKHRAAKVRRTFRFPYSCLSLRDGIHMECDDAVCFSGIPDTKDRILTREDAEDCYWENADAFNSPQTHATPAGHHPGRRCWSFWIFQKGYSEPPKEPVLVLHELGLLCHKEREDLTTWLKACPWRFSAAEKALIGSWRPPTQGTEIKNFPTNEAEEDDDLGING